MTRLLESLAIDHLSHETVKFRDQLDPELMMAAALKHGIGLDHFTGEEVIAVVDESKYAQAAADIISWVNESVDAQQFDGLIITNRRLIGNDPALSVPLDQIYGANVRGLVLKQVDVMTPHGNQSFEIEAAEQVARFLSAMIQQIPPEARIGEVRDLCRPSEGDPLGILDLVNRHDDDRVGQLLALASMMQARGTPEQQQGAVDLAWRASLFSRTVSYGRGSYGAYWISPLTPNDFVAVLHMMFGTPSRAWTDPSGAWCYQFVVRGSVAEAALKSAAGMVTGALIGIGGVVLPESWSCSLSVQPVGQYTGFTLADDDQSKREWAHVVLGAYEGRILLLRGAYGPTPPLDQLLAVHPRVIVDHLTPQLGACDLWAFYPDYAGDLSGMSPEIAAAMAAAQAKPMEQRVAEARQAWHSAFQGGNHDAMSDAALGLQHVQLYDESIAAYRTIAERHPHEAGHAWRSIGDCHLFRAEMGNGGTPDLDAALQAYEYAMQFPGQNRSYYEHNYFEAAQNLAHETSTPAPLHRYLQWFPQGDNEREAKQALREF